MKALFWIVVSGWIITSAVPEGRATPFVYVNFGTGYSSSTVYVPISYRTGSRYNPAGYLSSVDGVATYPRINSDRVIRNIAALGRVQQMKWNSYNLAYQHHLASTSQNNSAPEAQVESEKSQEPPRANPSIPDFVRKNPAMY